MNTRRERQPEPGSLDEARAIREEKRKKELELEALFHKELSELLSREQFERAEDILYSDVIGVKYAQPFIGLLLHATHLQSSRKGIREELRDPAVADDLIEKIFYELEGFIEDPRSEEWLEHKHKGDEWHLGPLERLFQKIHKRILDDIPVVGID